MVRLILLLLSFGIIAISASHQNYPGTNTRPVLSDSEAAQYTKTEYLQGWTPGQIQHSKADYTVGSGHYGRIQEAVNAAIKAGGTQRKYIRIQKGTYKEIVFIPKGTVPLTIYGTPGLPGDVVITMSISANSKASDWANQVNPNGKYFKEGDPAWSMFNSCAKKKTAGSCAEVVWGQSDNLEMAYLTINNPNKDGQGVAARFDGDKQNLDHLHLYGFQGMFSPILWLLPLWIVAISASHQNYPGTNTRPILSDAEAAQYTNSKYLQGWNPGQIQHSKADYTVGSGHYTYIQEAVNAAIKAGGTQRKYIHIQKGTYKQVVFIPKTTVPITIYGTYGSPEDVVITLTQSATTTASQWANHANPNEKVFKDGDPAWSMFNGCAKKDILGTFCSQIVWSKADNLEMAYLTINNPSVEGQAVAASFEGDKQNLDHLHLYGFQDTLFLNGKRIYLSSPTIKGDVDFIFGSASAVLEKAQIIGRGDRPRNVGVIFAPNTDKNQKYGFLVINSKITADDNVKSNKGLKLARAWDASATPNANGQLVIRESEIADVINVNAPYSPAATSARPYSGNNNKNRNLDDPHYNRFWEYKNEGAGA